MGTSGTAYGRFDAAAKRLLDVVLSTTLLLLLSPILVALAIAIKVDDGSSVLFRGRRIGRHGREFRMLKFRKMADDATGPPLTVSTDARLTRVGRFLVRSKLDEIPQLWNVLKGEMSLVGPRPEDRVFVELVPERYATILEVRPGITGLSQLAYAREGQILDPDDRMRDYVNRVLPQKASLDELYVRDRSPLMDLRILAWTGVAVVLRRDVAVDRNTGKLSARSRERSRVSAPSTTLEGEA